MTGSYSVMKLLQEYPALWLVIGLLILAYILSDAYVKSAANRSKARARRDALRARKKELIAAIGTETYYMEADAYLSLLDLDGTLADRAELSRLIHIAHLIDTAFHYNDVDWFAAHACDADYEDMVAGLKALSLKDMIHPVHDASDYRAWAARQDDEVATEALFAASDAIREDFDRRGGAARVRDAVHERLKPRMDQIIAA